MIKHHKLLAQRAVTILCTLMSSGASMIINRVALMPHWKSLSNTSEGVSSFVITIYNSLDLKAWLVRRRKRKDIYSSRRFFINQKLNLPRGPIQDQASMKKVCHYASSSSHTPNPQEKKGKFKACVIMLSLSRCQFPPHLKRTISTVNRQAVRLYCQIWTLSSVFRCFSWSKWWSDVFSNCSVPA